MKSYLTHVRQENSQWLYYMRNTGCYMINKDACTFKRSNSLFFGSIFFACRDTQRERERERQTDRQTDRETDRDLEREGKGTKNIPHHLTNP